MYYLWYLNYNMVCERFNPRNFLITLVHIHVKSETWRCRERGEGERKKMREHDIISIQ